MPRPKKKPDYDAAQIMKDFMDTVAEAFGTYDDRTDSRDPGLNAVAAEFGITALKTRKLLITAGVYSTALSRQIAELQSKKMKLEQIMSATGLSRASATPISLTQRSRITWRNCLLTRSGSGCIGSGNRNARSSAPNYPL